MQAICEMHVFKIFAKFSGSTPCWSFFIIKCFFIISLLTHKNDEFSSFSQFKFTIFSQINWLSKPTLAEVVSILKTRLRHRFFLLILRNFYEHFFVRKKELVASVLYWLYFPIFLLLLLGVYEETNAYNFFDLFNTRVKEIIVLNINTQLQMLLNRISLL